MDGGSARQARATLQEAQGGGRAGRESDRSMSTLIQHGEARAAVSAGPRRRCRLCVRPLPSARPRQRSRGGEGVLGRARASESQAPSTPMCGTLHRRLPARERLPPTAASQPTCLQPTTRSPQRMEMQVPDNAGSISMFKKQQLPQRGGDTGAWGWRPGPKTCWTGWSNCHQRLFWPRRAPRSRARRSVLARYPPRTRRENVTWQRVRAPGSV